MAASASCYPPLGLLSIATTLKNQLPFVDITIADETVIGFDAIVSQFVKGAIVGISALTTTYRHTLRFVFEALDKGCFVVLGNDHASWFAQLIIRDRGVHAVLVGDHTEYPFVDLVRWLLSGASGSPNIPGLVMNTTAGIVTCLPTKYPMESLPIPDRTLIDHAPYQSVFVQKFWRILSNQDVVPTTINLCRGCSKVNNRCSFCDIYDLSLDRVSPKRAWDEMSYLASQGIKYLWEVGDSFTSHPRWIEELAAARPREVAGELFVYARAQELANCKTVKLLAEIGVTRVNVGMESGDDEVLRIFNKGNLHGDLTNRRAALNLAREGIRAHVSLILGCPGETAGSLRRTEDLVEYLLEMEILSSVDAAVLYPLPGAPLWRILSTHSAFRDAMKTDLLPLDLRERFVKHFCRSSMDELIESRDRIFQMVEQAGGVAGGFG